MPTCSRSGTTTTVPACSTRCSAVNVSEEQRARMPNATFRDRMTLYLGGKEIQVLYFGNAHTKGDSVVFVPQDRIVYMSEVFFNEEFPNMAGGYGVSWIRVLDAVRALDADIFIPGHGPIPDDPKQTRAALERVRQILVDARDGIQNAIARGASEDQAVAAVTLDQYAQAICIRRTARRGPAANLSRTERNASMSIKIRSLVITAAVTVVAIVVGADRTVGPSVHAQTGAGQYEADLSWPKALPNRWALGGLGGVCVDSQDHVLILNRQDVNEGDLNAARLAPPLIEFDSAGNVVNSWGDLKVMDSRLHSCHFDAEGNVWIAASPSGMVQKVLARRKQAASHDRQERRVRFIRRDGEGQAAQLERRGVLHAVEHLRRSSEWRGLRF